MNLRTLNIEEFTNYQQNHPLSSFYQTVNYGMLMAEIGYDYELIGLVDDKNNILAASLILLKPIGIKCFYGYAPRGFLIDYHNEELVKNFTTKLKEYYYEKNVIFIKINPCLPVGEVDNKTFETIPNNNQPIINVLKNNSYKKLLDNLYFEAMLPRFNAIIDLKNFNFKNLNKNTKNKIKKSARKGLTFEHVEKNAIPKFYELIKNKEDFNEYYYHDFYTAFEKDQNIDLFLISINYYDFLQNSQYVYNEEAERNNKLNEKLVNNNSEKAINTKMNSDKILLSYKNDIMEATKGMAENKKVYIAGALVVKHNKTVSIIYSSYDKAYRRFVPNYFLHYNIIKYYQEEYDYLDLNGVVGDFKNDNVYSGLNRFKIGFNPHIYEYIGEYDLIVEPKSYDILLKNGILAKEFNKKAIKK